MLSRSHRCGAVAARYAVPDALPSAANDDRPYCEWGPDGLQFVARCKVQATGLRFLQANALLRAFEAKSAFKQSTNRSA